VLCCVCVGVRVLFLVLLVFLCPRTRPAHHILEPTMRGSLKNQSDFGLLLQKLSFVATSVNKTLT
jgi:hypothetical protein